MENEMNIMNIWRVVIERENRSDAECFYATEELADRFIKWFVSDFCKSEMLSEDEVKYSDDGIIEKALVDFYNGNHIVASVHKEVIEVLTA